MSDDVAPVEGAASPESTPAADSTPAAEPWAPVLDRVNELASGIDGRFAALEQRIPQPEAPEPVDPWAALMPQDQEPETFFDQYGNPVDMSQFQQQPALDVNALRQAMQAEMQQALSPYQQQIASLQMERGREQLYQQIPQLKDPEVARETERAMEEYLRSTGAPQQVAQWMINSPEAIAQFFKAAEADKLARAQVPAGETVPALESAGGAAPSGTNDQPNYVQSAFSSGFRLPPGLA